MTGIRKVREPYVFALIRQMLPSEREPAPEVRPLNDIVAYILMAGAGLAAFGFGFFSGVLRK